MDLMLSTFVTEDVPKVEKKKGKSSAGGTDSGGKFSMVFSKSQPVKAIVARKRVIPATAKKSETDNQEKSSEKTKPFSMRLEPPNKKQQNKLPVKKDNNLTKKANPKNVDKTPETADERPKFSLTEQFNKKVPQNRKSNIFDKLKTQMPKVDLPEVHPLTEKVFSDVTVDSLNIHPHSKKNVADLLGFKKLTVVQNLSIPKILSGKDVLIRAQTGSGKTLAYALPLVERLHSQDVKISRGDGILAVIVVPTRELALQTYELFVKLLKPFTWIVSGFLCGGEKRKAEKARLRAGLNILIGTPGRLCDHIKNTESMKFNAVKYLILDEADRLLELGYEKDVKEIVESIKEARQDQEESIQTALLSATLTNSVKELAGLTLNNPDYVDTSDIVVERRFDSINVEDIEDRITIPATVRQSYIIIPPKLRLVILCGAIAAEFNRKTNKALVFMATQDLVDYHYDVMVEVLTQEKPDSDNENDSDDDEEVSEDEESDSESKETILLPNVRFFKLHGKMTQIERSSVFKEFRSSKSAVLLCTDVAARGIDVPSVDLVVQFHAPQILSDYVHRVGRTARAGQSGKALLVVEPAEVEFVKYLTEKKIRLVEDPVDPIFNRIGLMVNKSVNRRNKNKEQAAVELQHRFEKLVAAEKELYSEACKAFVSWVRYYSNFPKELRRIFAIKAVNMGHYAKSLGLRDPPKQFMRHHTGPRDGDFGDDGGSGERKFNNRGKQGGNRSFGGTGKSFAKGGPLHNGQNRKRSFGASDRGSGGPGQRPFKPHQQQSQHRDLASYAQSSRMVNTSEFDSGFSSAPRSGGSARKKPRKH
ncbi:probable ATP-dependent RNA helicase CG8611 [Uranotaenia lowii]|uniref:probable ATP-dependent RNA helicase CG8611 n=1 Tax=Uranotaenia lowii TaxID=190385 RepID=UPI0024789CFC|nr:probable ATP-dependent RNA helicase CG8611 [Uranotaenia lowii]